MSAQHAYVYIPFHMVYLCHRKIPLCDPNQEDMEMVKYFPLALLISFALVCLVHAQDQSGIVTTIFILEL